MLYHSLEIDVALVVAFQFFVCEFSLASSLQIPQVPQHTNIEVIYTTFKDANIHVKFKFAELMNRISNWKLFVSSRVTVVRCKTSKNILFRRYEF